MRTYIQDKTKGACYFLTINLYDRNSQLLTKHIEQLRKAYQKTKKYQPFELNAIVVLPDHIHMLITLPIHSNNYSTIVSSFK